MKLQSTGIIIEPHHEKTCFMPYVNNKCSDHTAHSCSLISAFVVPYLANIVQSSRKRLIRRIFTPTFHVVRLKKSFRRFFRTPVFSISTCIIIVDFSLCSDQRRRLGVKISYCQQIKKITEALCLSAWCLSENGRRGVHVASACRNSQSEARIRQ